MYLYNLTWQKPTAITRAICGAFTSPKKQEILIASNTHLQLLTIDSTTGKLKTLISQNTFCQIRNIETFRWTGNKKENIVLTSDSGRLVILDVDPVKNCFIKLHQETFGKTGCRRIVPSEYIGIDPKGRAIMIGALEKQKFVYNINRDSDNKMTISSPWEAHKARIICYDIIGLDVGYDNPWFACIEVDYGDIDDEKSGMNTGNFQKMIVYYEMEISLNHVIRKNYEKIDFSAHLLVPVSRNSDNWIGGVWIFCENYVMYKDNNTNTNVKNKVIQAIYPQRYYNYYNKEENKKNILMINYSIYRRKELFFVIVQSEFGDLFKIELEYSDNNVKNILVNYYDTVPIGNSISIWQSGYLFLSAETSNHVWYTINTFEIDDTGSNVMHVDKEENTAIKSEDTQVVLFNPTWWRHLTQIDELPSLSCITDMLIEDITNEGTPQILTISGKGPRSTFNLLKPGLSVNIIGQSSWPGTPINVWSIKNEISDVYDKYIIVSFINATLVLGIGDKITEITNSGFDTKNSTIYVGILSDNTYIQVINTGIIHITKDKKSFLKSSSKINCACSNSKQILIGLENTEILYFEHDNKQWLKPDIKVIDTEIICIDLSPIPEGRTRSKHAAIGCGDKTIRIISLEIEQCLAKISLQVLPCAPSSIKFLKYNNETCDYLYIGWVNGVLIKTNVDNVTGMQSDMQTKYWGWESVKLFKIILNGEDCLLANSSKCYLCYKYLGKYNTEVINIEHMEAVTSFNSEQCVEAVISITQDALKIVNIENLDHKFTTKSWGLRYTPRKMLYNKGANTLVIIESDQHVYSNSEKEKYKTHISEISKDKELISLPEENIGVPYTGNGNWGSWIRILDPNAMTTLDLIELEGNECALSGCIVTFTSSPNEKYLLIGTAVGLEMLPHHNFKSANIIVFVFKDNDTKIDFLFKQPVNDIPLSFCEFQGKVLIGVGNILCLYDWGKNHLLKKCETRKITNTITQIQTNGSRILVSTMSESYYFLRHKIRENQFYIFADDIIPRWLVNTTFLDYDTIAGSDKFENFFVYRLPKYADEEENEALNATKKWEVGFLHGASYKINLIAQYHWGDLITNIKKTNLNGGSDNLLLYSTSCGSIGCFMPFETRDEVDFFIHLEMYSRIEIDNIGGREHQMYRSCYGPVKCVIDGDLCEEFVKLDASAQKVIAGELDKSIKDVVNKWEDIKNKII